MRDLLDSRGRPVALGKRLGTGGEGTVYEVDAMGLDAVAKVYHESLTHEKQAKLRGMVKGCNESLKRIAAWPFEILQQTEGSGICGLLMPKLLGYEPIHHLYSPAHRKQRYPDKDWEFLVNTARNMAAAFETIHLHGHVIGDVNPNLVFFASNSIVKLIDCDSFQVDVDGQVYLCEVGVPHFTPPELQQYESFRGIRRTKNHDNFGLALLIFHILLMGRHPFSGIFGDQGFIPIEKSIEQYHYTFGSDAAGKRITPPPNSVTPAILPESVAQLFERAFSQRGSQPDYRPTAREWMNELDLLKTRIVTCAQDPSHKYYGRLSVCPWCWQEQQSGIYFFLSFEASTVSVGGFNIEQAWQHIRAVESPGPAPSIDTLTVTVTPRPLPPDLIGFFASLKPWKMSAEKLRRQEALEAAQRRLRILKKEWEDNASDAGFQAKIEELSSFRLEYQRLADQMAIERQKLQQNLRESQLQRFLSRFFLDNQYIPGLGSAQKASLASFGIETAADINRYNILRLKRLGERITNDLLEWRTGLENQFVFDPALGVDPADIAVVSQRFAKRRKQIESELLSGPEKLNLLRDQALQNRSQMLPVIRSVAQQLVQAEADLALMA
jgi:DNA-binding helix-hairpin-helix protein with protein kinase domain